MSEKPENLLAGLSRFQLAYDTGLERDIEPLSREAVDEGMRLLLTPPPPSTQDAGKEKRDLGLTEPSSDHLTPIQKPLTHAPFVGEDALEQNALRSAIYNAAIHAGHEGEYAEYDWLQEVPRTSMTVELVSALHRLGYRITEKAPSVVLETDLAKGPCLQSQIPVVTPAASTQNTVKGQKERSVQPSWCLALPLQQQSVLLLAARGPDGIAKAHPCKDVQRAYRGTVLVAAKYGRCLEWGEKADSFMSLELMTKENDWNWLLDNFFKHADDLPHHFFMHLMHGVEILGYKHPDERFKTRWNAFYERCVKELHLVVESELEMDARLSDWERKHWTGASVPSATPALVAPGVSAEGEKVPNETKSIDVEEWTVEGKKQNELSD